MSLKLFRHTDYAHSILSPGETRFALHPGWAVVALSLWVGFACNPWLWHAVASGTNLGRSLMAGVVIAGGAGFVLSLFGWRRTFKTIATFMLLGAALMAAGAWTQDVSLASVMESQRAALVMPSWASFFGWQVPLLLAVIGFLPMLWVWNAHLRRLAGPEQLGVNITGMVIAAVIVGGTVFMLPMVGS